MRASVSRYCAASFAARGQAGEVGSRRYCPGVCTNSACCGGAFMRPGMSRSGSDRSGSSPRVAASKVARETPSFCGVRPGRLQPLRECFGECRSRKNNRENERNDKPHSAVQAPSIPAGVDFSMWPSSQSIRLERLHIGFRGCRGDLLPRAYRRAARRPHRGYGAHDPPQCFLLRSYALLHFYHGFGPSRNKAILARPVAPRLEHHSFPFVARSMPVPCGATP